MLKRLRIEDIIPEQIFTHHSGNYVAIKDWEVRDSVPYDHRVWWYLYEYDGLSGYNLLGYTPNSKMAAQCLEYGPGGVTITIPTMGDTMLRRIPWGKNELVAEAKGGRLIEEDIKKEDVPQGPMYFGNKSNIENLIRGLLYSIGENADRPGLKDTPARVARFWDEFINYDPGNIDTQFVHNGFDQIVLVKDIPFYSLCEHHLLPFWGKISVAYITSGQVLGLSKIPRIVQKYAHGLQLQEQLCQQIADELVELLLHDNVAVIGSAIHTCMVMRGIKSEGTMKTSVMWGKFRGEPETRSELFALLRE